MTKNARPRPADAAQGASFFLRKAAHDPRAAALVAVSRVLSGEADSQEALDQALQSGTMVPSDKGLCAELMYGHLRAHLRLRWFAERCLRKPEKLPWEMRLAMEQALYAMAFLRIPHRATVHQAVDHVRNRFGKALAGVANGALRAMQAELASFTDRALYARESATEEEALSRWFAMPLWIVSLWRQAYGAEGCERLLELSAAAPPQGLRLNRARQGWEMLRTNLLREGREKNASGDPLAGSSGQAPDVEAVGACGLVFSRSLPFAAKQLVASGLASGQSAASYAALEFFQPREFAQPIWDCCAGRGGKSMALLEQGIPVALASDPSRRRLDALAEEYARLGLTDPPCPVLLESQADAAQDHCAHPEATGKKPPAAFGTVLVDAPCSGLGTLGRRPEIRYRRSEADCARLVEIQKRILDAAWAKLLPGGRLLYITCTANPAENEGQTASFLSRQPEARLVKEYRAEDCARFREYFYGAMLERKA